MNIKNILKTVEFANITIFPSPIIEHEGIFNRVLIKMPNRKNRKQSIRISGTNYLVYF